MNDLETQKRFVQLRIQGWSYDRIAVELKISRRTVINWSRKYRFEIQNERAMTMDNLREQLLSSREVQARALAGQLKAVEAELAKRNVSDLSTTRLFSLAAALRRQIQQETGDMHFVVPLDEIPEDEYHERSQEWIP